VKCDPRLASLYVRAIAHYRDYERHPFIVPDSIPILYFGNLQGYRNSAIKIVTVGLNPSDAEFPGDRDRFGREVRESLEPETLEGALSNYFAKDPYRDWFDRGFETLLQPLTASFYGEKYPGPTPLRWKWNPQPKVALHTDLCSPLATTPTWKNLPTAVWRELREWGVPLWEALVAGLDPDIILMSVGKPHLDELGTLPWRSFNPFSDGLAKHKMMITRFGYTHIIWGRTGRGRPFLNFSYEQRPAAAQAILAQPELESLRSRIGGM
jgi:hypothetical protein